MRHAVQVRFQKRMKPYTIGNSPVSQDKVVCYHVAKIAYDHVAKSN